LGTQRVEPWGCISKSSSERGTINRDERVDEIIIIIIIIIIIKKEEEEKDMMEMAGMCPGHTCARQ
jgi:hypothetical protein